jgi:hypothetical protein
LSESPVQGFIAALGGLIMAVLGVVFVWRVGDLVARKMRDRRPSRHSLQREELIGGEDVEDGDVYDEEGGEENGDNEGGEEDDEEYDPGRSMAWSSVNEPSFEARALRPSFDAHAYQHSIVTTRKHNRRCRVGWALLWILGAIVMCAPSIVYALSTTVPATAGTTNGYVKCREICHTVTRSVKLALHDLVVS